MLNMRVDDDQIVFFNRKMLVFNQEFSTSLTDVKEFREGHGYVGCWASLPHNEKKRRSPGLLPLKKAYHLKKKKTVCSYVPPRTEKFFNCQDSTKDKIPQDF